MVTKLNQRQKAAQDVKDEFFTRYVDVEKELSHYPNSFRGKSVYLPCDDPFHSEFFRYFVLNFRRLGLGSLTATSYRESWTDNRQMTIDELLYGKEHVEEGKGFGKAWLCRITNVPDNPASTDLSVESLVRLPGNSLGELRQGGDFRSPECLSLLCKADVVVTNPPFSLLAEFIDILESQGKKFLIMGNLNVLSAEKVFRYVVENRLWTGYGFNSKKLFSVPDDYPTNTDKVDEEGRKQVVVQAVTWFTNMDVAKRHVPLSLHSRYHGNESGWNRYDTFDALEVPEWKDIPKDYAGIMGVPVTFLNRYDPDQFEILGLDSMVVPGWALDGGRLTLGNKRKYMRVMIRNKKPERFKEMEEKEM